MEYDMEYIYSLINMLEIIKKRNQKQLGICSEDKIQQDPEYAKLYKAYWGCDVQLENVLDLLKVIKNK